MRQKMAQLNLKPFTVLHIHLQYCNCILTQKKKLYRLNLHFLQVSRFIFLTRALSHLILHFIQRISLFLLFANVSNMFCFLFLSLNFLSKMEVRIYICSFPLSINCVQYILVYFFLFRMVESLSTKIKR